MFRIEFELTGLPPTANGSHQHWRAAWAIQQEWKNRVRLRTFMQRPQSPLTKCRIECTRFSTSRPDRDNLAFSFKRCLDGLTAAGIIVDDSDDVITEIKYLWEKSGRGKGKIKIVVEQVE